MKHIWFTSTLETGEIDTLDKDRQRTASWVKRTTAVLLALSVRVAAAAADDDCADSIATLKNGLARLAADRIDGVLGAVVASTAERLLRQAERSSDLFRVKDADGSHLFGNWRSSARRRTDRHGPAIRVASPCGPAARASGPSYRPRANALANRGQAAAIRSDTRQDGRGRP